MPGWPRTAIGTSGDIAVRRRGTRAIAETRVRDEDGRIRHIRVTARTAEQARARLKQRMLSRPGFNDGGVLTTRYRGSWVRVRRSQEDACPAESCFIPETPDVTLDSVLIAMDAPNYVRGTEA